jgi:hypothetical protein
MIAPPWPVDCSPTVGRFRVVRAGDKGRIFSVSGFVMWEISAWVEGVDLVWRGRGVDDGADAETTCNN